MRMTAFPSMSLARAAAVCAVAAGAATAAAPAATPAQRTLTPDDLYRVQDVSDPQVSPDGGWVAYVVTNNVRESDEARSAVWMASWDGRERLALTPAAEGISKPRWSPDGRYLAYLAVADGTAKTQIMLLDRRGGDAQPLVKFDGDIGEYAWAPDGRRVVFAAVQVESGATPKPIVIEALHFKDDAEGYLAAGQRRHLYLADVEKREVVGLTFDSGFNENLPAWSPDGRHIAFIRTRERATDQDGREDIDVMDARAGAEPHTVVRPFAPNNQRLAWSPDGTMIAYLQGLEPKFNAYMQDRLFVVPAMGGAPRVLSDTLDRVVQSYAFADETSILVTVEDDRTLYPARIDLTGGAITRLTAAAPFVVTALSSAAGHTVLLKTNDEAPDEVYALEGGTLRKLTAHNDEFLAGLKLGAAEDIRFKGRDGADIHGIIIKPPAFVPGRKYPTVLWIHGGPNGQDEHSLSLDGYQFEPQMFAAKGFVVLRVNYRGGSGRGAAFAKAIYADWGHLEVLDLLAGVDYLVAAGIADRDRLAVGGWSYGGILTDYTIASDTRFKAAISGAGSANQLSTYGSDEYVLQYNHELGPPWTNTALWLKVSYPFFHADRIRTPTLFLGGEKDFNVPIMGGEQMYQSLRTLGVPAQLVVYPGQHHVISRPSFVKDLAERMSAWLDRFVPPPH
jgi:dipeptidyl aminopeptidase/acylaminoacyl peptidase